jgi:hypothetical protein
VQAVRGCELASWWVVVLVAAKVVSNELELVSRWVNGLMVGKVVSICQLRSLGALGVLVNHIIESKELN